MTATTTMPPTKTNNLLAAFLAEFEALEKAAANQRPALRRLRKAAISRFAELGFPGPRDEEWRFTPLGPLLKAPLEPADEAMPLTGDEIRRLDFAVPECATLAFVNGRFRHELSQLRPLPAGVVVGSLNQAFAKQGELAEAHLGRIAKFDQQAFTALNTALFADGAFVHLPAGAVLETPLRILHVSLPGASPKASFPRVLILAEARSQATVLESYVGPADAVYLTNAVTEISLGEGAIVQHVKLQRESAKAFHIGAMSVKLARAANFKNLSIALGGALTRNDFSATLEGEGAEATLNGLTLADGERLVDNHTAIDHAVPNCPSHEIYKNVIRDRGKVVFNGKIFVRQDAQKTDAKQTNQTLLLSPDGTVNTKPQLEIFADDVKCTHGATVGQLDDESLFYLRSRGIGEGQARSLLTFAFANDLIERLPIASLRAALEALLLEQAHLAPAGPAGKESA